MSEKFNMEERISMLKAVAMIAETKGMNEAQAEHFFIKETTEQRLSMYDDQGFPVTEDEFLSRLKVLA